MFSNKALCYELGNVTTRSKAFYAVFFFFLIVEFVSILFKKIKTKP